MRNLFNCLLKLLFISLACAPLMHCGTLPDDVKVRDRQASNYNIKISRDIPDTRLGLAIEYQDTSGEGNQFFPEVRSKSNNTTTTLIRPAMTTHNEFSLRSTSVIGKWNALKSPHIGINVYLGGTEINSHVDIIEASGKTTPIGHKATTLIQKFELYLPITDKLRVSGGVSEALRADTELLTYTLSVDYQLSKLLQLSLGYRRCNYEFSTDAVFNSNYSESMLNIDSHSDISLDTGGLLAGVTLTF